MQKLKNQSAAHKIIAVLYHTQSRSTVILLPHCSPLRSVSCVFHNKDWIGLDHSVNVSDLDLNQQTIHQKRVKRG